MRQEKINNIVKDLKHLMGSYRIDTIDEAREYLQSDDNSIVVINCEGEYDDLEYYDKHFGNEAFRKIMDKYGKELSMEWINSCQVMLYLDF